MDSTEFRVAAHDLVDFMIDYMDNIRNRRVLPTVEPGYVRQLIPDEAPENPETWEDVKKDIERVIMPGVRKKYTASMYLVSKRCIYK